jgi:hypothetical protein
MSLVKNILLLIVSITISVSSHGNDFEKIIFSSPYQNIEDFKDFVEKAKNAGATHITISNNLPPAFWKYDTPGDPYPAWYIDKHSLLHIFPPGSIEKFIPKAHIEKVLKALDERCTILRKNDLKAHYHCSEPAVLPEGVFQENPLWRGPKVDQPMRSNVPRWAPSIDNPEVQELYRIAMKSLLKRYPEVDVFTMLTNDSGAGLGWSEGLYSGVLGNTIYRRNTTTDRIQFLFSALKNGAAEAGVDIDLKINNTREKYPEKIARQLSEGMAVESYEGPDASLFSTGAGVRSVYGNMFTPVYGIPQPDHFISSLSRAKKSNAARLFVNLSDHVTRDFYFSLYKKLNAVVLNDRADEIVFLKQMAVEQVGEENAADLVQMWLNIEKAADYINLTHAGGRIFYLGSVHQRWLIRPFVPYPDEIPDSISQTWQKYQFQAIPERMNSLCDVQANDMFCGWGSWRILRNILNPVEKELINAIKIAENLGYEDLARRMKIMNCIVNNALNAVSYQAQLDRVEEIGIKPDEHIYSRTGNSWDRQRMMETARLEIDNIALLIQFLEDNPKNYLSIAATFKEKEIKQYGPDIIEELKRKINIMNAHWEDYERMFTTPNL